MNERSLEQLKSFLKTIDKGVSQKEFIRAFQIFMSVLKDIKDYNERSLKDNSSATYELIEDAFTKMKKLEKSIDKVIINFEVTTQAELDKSFNKLKLDTERIIDMLPEEVDLSPIYDKINEVESNLEFDIEKVSNAIYDKINDVEFDIEKVSNAIKNLDERTAKDSTQVFKQPFFGRAGIQVYDGLSKVGARVFDISFGAGLSVSIVNGLLTVSSTGGGTGYTKATPTGAINGSNNTYVVEAEPVYVIADGTTYFDGAGYTYSALSIVMDNAPTQYIRYFY